MNMTDINFAVATFVIEILKMCKKQTPNAYKYS